MLKPAGHEYRHTHISRVKVKNPKAPAVKREAEEDWADFEFVLGHKRCHRTRDLYVEVILTPKMKRDAAVHPSSRLAPSPTKSPGKAQRGIKHHPWAAGAGLRRKARFYLAFGTARTSMR